MKNNKVKMIGLGFICLVIGIMLGGTAQDPERLVRNAASQVSPTTVVTHDAKWRELKTIDDQLIHSCSQNFAVVSDIFKAQAKLDFDTVAKKNIELSAGADAASKLADLRNNVVKELGLE